MNEVDQLFASLAAYGEALAERREQDRERRRVAANTRRRTLYAARRAAGTLPPRRPATAIEPGPEYDEPTACYCHTTSMPPCGWCEAGNNDDDEGTP